MMRTGADYRETLRSDGRQVWVLGAGRVADVTTHPATSAMIDEYVAWYDRHRDPAWRDALIAPASADREAAPWAFTVPRNTGDLIGIGRSFARTLFHSAGNITHDPAYGHLIAMGVLTAVQQRNASEKQIADAEAYRRLIADSGRFLTFCGGAAPIGFRLREDPAARAALRIVRETDFGGVLSGKVGMHTSPAYAEDVYIGALNGVQIGEHHASFIVPVAALGVTTICRKIAARSHGR